MSRDTDVTGRRGWGAGLQMRSSGLPKAKAWIALHRNIPWRFWHMFPKVQRTVGELARWSLVGSNEASGYEGYGR